jgi:hypothetical protein
MAARLGNRRRSYLRVRRGAFKRAFGVPMGWGFISVKRSKPLHSL